MSGALFTESLLVASDYVHFSLGLQRSPPNQTAETLRYLATETEPKVAEKIRPLLQDILSDNPRIDPCHLLRAVMVNLGSGARLNWGRVVALFTFTGILAREMRLRGRGPECAGKLAEAVAEYLSVEVGEWMEQNGGWGGFNTFFHHTRPSTQESSLRTALFAAAGVGIAGIMFLLVR